MYYFLECTLANCKHFGEEARVLLTHLQAAELCSRVCLHTLRLIWKLFSTTSCSDHLHPHADLKKKKKNSFYLEVKSTKSCIIAENSINANLRIGKIKMFSPLL